MIDLVGEVLTAAWNVRESHQDWLAAEGVSPVAIYCPFPRLHGHFGVCRAQFHGNTYEPALDGTPVIVMGVSEHPDEEIIDLLEGKKGEKRRGGRRRGKEGGRGRKKGKEREGKVKGEEEKGMSPAMRLSKFKQVVIIALASKSFDAAPRSGDLSGSSADIQPGEVTGVIITIDQILP